MASMKTRCKDTDFPASRQTETGFPRNLGIPVRATENARVPLPNAFSYLLWAAQLQIGLATRLFCGHSSGNVLIRLMRDVRFQLAREIGVFIATLKESAKSHLRSLLNLFSGPGQHAANGFHHLLPAAGFRQQLLAAFCGQLVILGFAIVFAGAPV